MAFSYRELFCGGKTFCCCLPVRVGAIIMSILGILVGGVLSIILWFEIASSRDMAAGEKAGFVVAALIETLLFIGSALGFVGAIVRKQSFLQIYAYFTYLHFLLNIGIAGYVLYLVTHFTGNAAEKACQETIKDPQAQEQCTGLLKVGRGVYFAIAAIVLLVELYVAIIVTRYVNQVKNEKRSARGFRLGNEEAFSLVSKGEGRYTPLAPGHSQDNTSQVDDESEFNPYEGIPDATRRSLKHIVVPALPEEEGYGGGSWTISDITAEEKTRLEQNDNVSEVIDERALTRAPHGKQSNAMEAPASNELPKYALSDPF